jgi:hypothetical protein
MPRPGQRKRSRPWPSLWAVAKAEPPDARQQREAAVAKAGKIIKARHEFALFQRNGELIRVIRPLQSARFPNPIAEFRRALPEWIDDQIAAAIRVAEKTGPSPPADHVRNWLGENLPPCPSSAPGVFGQVPERA